jgi:hypothetical protein
MNARQALTRKLKDSQSKLEAVNLAYQCRLLSQLAGDTVCYMPDLFPNRHWPFDVPMASVEVIILGRGIEGRAEYYQAVRDEDLPHVQENQQFPTLVFHDTDRGKPYLFSRMGFIDISVN